MFENLDLGGLTGTVVTPDDPEYHKARQEYNRSIQRFPLVLVYCLGERDVRNAVLWARDHGIGIRIRAGGHNYEGYSVGNGVLVIDLSLMDAVRIDGRRRAVEAQGGASNRKVYATLAREGLPFAGGSCPTVGAAGYAMGGGWNFFCRHWGFGCDWLEEVRLVNWQGKILTANERVNPDLYWACRGGGDGNFGVAVSLTFSLPPDPGRVTYFTLNHPDASAEDQAEFLENWQRWLPGLSPRMTLRPSLYNSLEEGLAIFSRGICFGRPEDVRRLLRPLLAGGGYEVTADYVPFDEAVRLIGSVYPPSEMFQTTGRFVQTMFSREEIRRIVCLLHELPEGLELVELGLFAMGGRVRRVSPGCTAFFYRDADYILGMQAVWTEPESAGAGHAWVRRAFSMIEPLTAGSFVNFPYSGLDDYERAYYGGNVPRLRSVKRHYDPEDVFNYPQGIRVQGT